MNNEAISMREPEHSSAQTEQPLAGAFDFGGTGVRIHATLTRIPLFLGWGTLVTELPSSKSS
jgi:hypothetical protein